MKSSPIIQALYVVQNANPASSSQPYLLVSPTMATTTKLGFLIKVENGWAASDATLDGAQSTSIIRVSEPTTHEDKNLIQSARSPCNWRLLTRSEESVCTGFCAI